MNPLAHPVCLTWPARRTSVGWWHEHIPFAMYLVDVLRPRVLVELGVQAGDSYCAFCQAVTTLGLGTRCFGVDTWRGDPHAGFYGPMVLADLRAHHDARYGSFSTLVQSTFDEALSRFADGTVDLLHIDGYHTYEAARHDVDAWLPKMSRGGIVLLHDTHVQARDFGIARLWEELKRGHPAFEFPHGSGLGVLAIGEIGAPELAAVFDAAPADADSIRSFFFALGRRLSLTDEVEALDVARQALTVGQAGLPRLHGPSVLQLFWTQGGEFSEAHSIATPLAVDGEVHDYELALPADAAGPLRLDVGNRPGYVEVHRVAIGTAGGDPVWVADLDDAGSLRLSGVIRLRGPGTPRFVCTDEDPQLVLTAVPVRADTRPWVLRATLRASAGVLGPMIDALQELERDNARLRHERPGA